MTIESSQEPVSDPVTARSISHQQQLGQRPLHSSRQRGMRKPRARNQLAPPPAKSPAPPPAKSSESKTAFRLAIVGIVGTLLAGVLGAYLQSSQSAADFARTEQKAAYVALVTDATKESDDAFQCSQYLRDSNPIPNESVDSVNALHISIPNDSTALTQDAFVVDIIGSREASDLASVIFPKYNRIAAECDRDLQKKLKGLAVDPVVAQAYYDRLQAAGGDISSFLTQARKDLGSS